MTAYLQKLEAIDGGAARVNDPAKSRREVAETPSAGQVRELLAVPRAGWLDGPGRFWARG